MDVESNFIEIEYSSKVAKYLLLVYLPCQASKVEEISVAVKGLNLSKKKKKKKERTKSDAVFGTTKEREKREKESGVRIIPKELLNQISCPKMCKVYQTAKSQIQSNSRGARLHYDGRGSSAIKCIKLFHALD